MNKFIVNWFEITKALTSIFLGLIPAIVFRMYADHGETYDAFYSIAVWALLLLMELGQITVTAYIQKTEKEKD